MTKDEFVKAAIRKKYDWSSIVFERTVGFYTDRFIQNMVLVNLFMEDDDVVEEVFIYWNEKIEEYTIGSIKGKNVDFFNEIMENYYRTIITDKWADEVGLKYYY